MNAKTPIQNKTGEDYQRNIPWSRDSRSIPELGDGSACRCAKNTTKRKRTTPEDGDGLAKNIMAQQKAEATAIPNKKSNKKKKEGGTKRKRRKKKKRKTRRKKKKKRKNKTRRRKNKKRKKKTRRRRK